jgi:uncharacterized membrane protein
VGKKKWPGWHQPTQERTMSTAVAYPTTAELTLQAKHFEGPLPPPEQLKQYEEVSPGFAERIVQMAEKEQDFRHHDTERIRGMQRTIIGRGQVFGFILSLVSSSAEFY